MKKAILQALIFLVPVTAIVVSISALSQGDSWVAVVSRATSAGAMLFGLLGLLFAEQAKDNAKRAIQTAERAIQAAEVAIEAAQQAVELSRRSSNPAAFSEGGYHPDDEFGFR